jgi:hypothetical protein
MAKSLLSACCLAILLAPAAGSAGPRVLRAIEQAAESRALDISLSSDTDGRVLARLCDQCELLTLRVDAETAVYLDGARASLRTAVERRAQGATVVYDPEQRVVKRILLWD